MIFGTANSLARRVDALAHAPALVIQCITGRCTTGVRPGTQCWRNTLFSVQLATCFSGVPYPTTAPACIIRNLIITLRR
jgi:hypothetical protein